MAAGVSEGTSLATSEPGGPPAIDGVPSVSPRAESLEAGLEPVVGARDGEHVRHVLPLVGVGEAQPTTPRALHAPTQRVHVTSSPIARWSRRPSGLGVPSTCSTNGSRTQVPTFSFAITLASANVAADIGTSSYSWIGFSRVHARA
jgi:hypothetical protein